MLFVEFYFYKSRSVSLRRLLDSDFQTTKHWEAALWSYEGRLYLLFFGGKGWVVVAVYVVSCRLAFVVRDRCCCETFWAHSFPFVWWNTYAFDEIISFSSGFEEIWQDFRKSRGRAQADPSSQRAKIGNPRISSFGFPKNTCYVTHPWSFYTDLGIIIHILQI